MVFKDASVLYPAHDDITGRDWNDIVTDPPSASAPPIPANPAADPTLLLKPIGEGIKTIAKHTQSAQDAQDKLNEVINKNLLKTDANDVFTVYKLKKMRKRITKL